MTAPTNLSMLSVQERRCRLADTFPISHFLERVKEYVQIRLNYIWELDT